MRLKCECHHNQRVEQRDMLEHLLFVARRLATKVGVDAQRQEDFAAQFATKMLCEGKHNLLRYWEGQLSENWMQRCVYNSLMNFLRVERSIRAHETQWPQIEDENGNLMDLDYIATIPGPQSILLRKELRCLIERAIDHLDPANAELERV